MIEIFITKQHIEIKGHAQYANKGHDIVCAAVSGLTCSVIKSLQGFKKRDVRIMDGNVMINLDRPIREDDQIRLDVLRQGLHLIAKQYPKYVKIKERK